MSDEITRFGDDFGKQLIEEVQQREAKANLERAAGAVTTVVADITNDKRNIAVCTRRLALNERRLKAIQENKFTLVLDEGVQYVDPRKLGRSSQVIVYDDEELN
jgi:hypothetical protein